jgi:molybdate transport system permease protein
MMDERTFDWTPLWLTFRVASLTTGILLVVCVPLAYWLARRNGRGSGRSARVLNVLNIIFKAVLTLPMVLPPTVLGFYFLVAFGRESRFGAWLQDVVGVELVFTFWGVVLGSVVYSLPFMLQPLQAGLEAVFVAHGDLLDAARAMGASRKQVLMRVMAPLVSRSLVAGCVLAFAHTIGEFGVVMMIGGNIAGETRVASIALYDEVQAMNYAAAHEYALVLLVVSFVLLVAVYAVQARQN